MSDQQFNARISSFTKEQGFGKVTLGDGSEVSFDYSVCNFEPSLGDEVLVKLGPKRWGGGMKVIEMIQADEG